VAAKERFNFHLLNDREMLVTQYDRSMLQNTQANVFVKNLARTVTNRALYSLFRPHGDIFSSKVAQDYRGNSKGYGFVQYRERDSALKAIKELNGTMLEEHKLLVEQYKLPERKERSEKGFTNIYVKNLPPSVVTQEALERLFAPYEQPSSLILMEHELLGKKSFFGFINLKTAELATKAVAEMNGKEIEGVRLYVSKALSKDQRAREKLRLKSEQQAQSRKFTLHVRTASNEPITEDVIRRELQPFGEPAKINIRTNKTPEGQDANQAVAFVVMPTEEAATRVPPPILVTILGRPQLSQARIPRRQHPRREGPAGDEAAPGATRTTV
jgi:polyadenylate-binding protein